MEDSDKQDLSLFWSVTIIALANASVPLLVELVVMIACRDTKYECQLRRQLSDLKAELGSISMANEFAKYMKIERKANKLKDDLKSRNNQRTLNRIKMRIISYAIFYAIFGILTSYMVWSYRYTPILRISTDQLFPLNYILAFPTGEKDAIGIMPWLGLCGIVFRRSIKMIA